MYLNRERKLKEREKYTVYGKKEKWYISIYYYKRANELKIVSHSDISYPPKLLTLRSTLESDPTHLKFPL
jgi:hypothetical protein